MMRDLTPLVVFFVMMIESAISKPLWSTLIGNNYLYSTSEVDAQPQYLGVATYQDTHSPYYIYNIHTNIAGIPSTFLTTGKPGIAQVPAYSFYYGTPLYDFQIPLNSIYPVLTPSRPVLPPILPPGSTERPFDVDDDDGIEKLDSKTDPDAEIKKPENIQQDNDTVTVEAL